MNRRTILQTLSALSAASIIPSISPAAKRRLASLRGGSPCWLTPLETEGPFYFDPQMLRRDITIEPSNNEVYQGIPLHLTLTVIDIDCNPVPNVLVDIWHCDKDGVYSGYPGQLGGLDTTGKKFLRGYQMTDQNGKVEFDTIWPGWYPGRCTHVHFKVRLTSTTYLTSQWAFNEAHNAAVYATPLYSTHGQSTTSNKQDGVFGGQALPEHQMMETTPNGSGGYDGTYTIGINAPAGVRNPELETGGQFKLMQNAPNPVREKTEFAFTLTNDSRVTLELYDVMGNRVATIANTRLSAGPHTIEWDRTLTPLPAGFYVYQLTVSNSAGTFSQSKGCVVE